jgi:hypothetical protein
VKLRGRFIQGRGADLPTMIWLSDLLEPAENFQSFFNRPDNKVLDIRNVWLLNYRNFGDSDHHDSFSLEVRISDLAAIIDVNNNFIIGFIK